MEKGRMTGASQDEEQADGEQASVDAADAFETLDRLASSRYSCRGFLPQPVPRADIERILLLAQRTASWCNAQPWQVVITSGEETERFRRRLLEGAAGPAEPDFAWPREYRDVYLQRRRECGFALYRSVGVAREDREGRARQERENFRLFGAPHIAIVTSPEALGVYGAIDCGAYVSNFMLAARSLGVASIAQASLASRARLVREHLGLPPDRLIVCGISFGYEDPEHPANRFRTVRAEPRDAVTWLGEPAAD
jgi:nitroreductase